MRCNGSQGHQRHEIHVGHSKADSVPEPDEWMEDRPSNWPYASNDERDRQGAASSIIFAPAAEDARRDAPNSLSFSDEFAKATPYQLRFGGSRRDKQTERSVR